MGPVFNARAIEYLDQNLRPQQLGQVRAALQFTLYTLHSCARPRILPRAPFTRRAGSERAGLRV